jgi:CzcA family heavy metal efflux pump
MVDQILKWSIENRFLVVLLTAALLVWGGLQVPQMPVDVLPDLTAPTVTVIAEAHGMAPEELEALLVRPIEGALQGSPGVRRVRSNTSVGIGVILVEFEWGVDLKDARQAVTERLQQATASLPPEAEPPLIGPPTSALGEILFLAVHGEGRTGLELRAAAYDIQRDLQAVPGVSQVLLMGGETKQLQVLLEPARLLAYDLSALEVAQAIEQGNENSSAGILTEGGQERLVYALGRARDAEDLRQRVVTTREGVPVLVRDVAQVVEAPDPVRRGAGSFNERDAVILMIQKQPGVNTLAVTARLERRLDELTKSLPEGVLVERRVLRQADFIEVAVSNVAEALRDGALLVVLILGFFLVSGRATLITAITIPLSLLVSVLVLEQLGITLNTMTLGGLAISVGAVVDDAIIDLENVVRRLREEAQRGWTRPALTVVLEASQEIRASIVFATLIILLVFAPIFALEGIEGRLLQPMGLAYLISLGASLVVALTVTPALCAILMPKARAVRRHDEPWLPRILKRLYEPVLGLVLRRWAWVSAGALLAFVASMGSLRWAGQTFLPEFNEGALTVSAVTLPGTSLAESEALGRRVEAALRRHPEVTRTARRTGRAEQDAHAQGVNGSEVEVGLSLKERPKEEMLEAMREDLGQIPGLNTTIGQPISHRIDETISGERANLAVKISGPDLRELQRLSAQTRAVMRGVAGVTDLGAEQPLDVPFVTVRIKREALARYGLQVNDVTHDLEIALGGVKVGQILEGRRVVDITVRYAPERADEVAELEALSLHAPIGGHVPLGEVAEVRRDLRPGSITREDGVRQLAITCNIAGGDPGAVAAQVEREVRAQVSLPEGYQLRFHGLFERAQAATRRLLWVGGVAVLGIFVLLVVAFRSGRDALLVMVNLPLALIGGVVGVWVDGGVVSVASLVGFVTLFGIATRNGIMMVSHIQHLRQHEGVTDPTEAVRRGASERLVPIVMTALAAGLGLVPLALEAGEPGSEIQAPMAIVTLFGLASSLALNMLVVPALYLRFGNGSKPPAEPLS